MTCDICNRPFNYCFYINGAFWQKAVGRDEGHWCAHCVLEKLGGLDWYIIWNEMGERMMKEHREHDSAEGAEKRSGLEDGYSRLRDFWVL